MSSCLEKVIEKLTAYKEGVLTRTAEMRPASTPEGEGPKGYIADPHAPPGSCKDWGAPGLLHALIPSIVVKEEHQTSDNRKSEMFPPVEHLPVHIKEEPREEDEAPHYFSHLKEESASPEDSHLLRHPIFTIFPVSYLSSDCGKSHFLSPPRVHTGDKPFCCPECGKCFSQRSYFVSHQRVHSGESPFCCFLCGKSFRVKSGLNKHPRSHQAENPFTCPLCHKSFIHRGHFLAHQRLHAEEEKYSCPLCGKSFIHHGHFLAHQRSHTEETRFSCPHCHKSFIHQGHYSAHLRVHTGEKPFTCPDCGSSFTTHHNLVVHQRLHTGPSFTLL